LIISYAYLWRDQQRRGAEEGRKDRPCAVVMTLRDAEGDTVVYVAPVTHSPPGNADAVEIPPSVKRRLGLDANRSWIVADELNRYVWPGFDLRPVSRDRPGVFHWGFLPVELFDKLRAAVLECQKRGRLGLVDRQ
jgi:hypothetical protein